MWMSLDFESVSQQTCNNVRLVNSKSSYRFQGDLFGVSVNVENGPCVEVPDRSEVFE